MRRGSGYAGGEHQSWFLQDVNHGVGIGLSDILFLRKNTQEDVRVALPFFGKKPVPAGSSAPRSRSGQGAASAPLSSASRLRPVASRNDTSSLDFTVAGGDVNRVLAQCADKMHLEEGVDEMAPSAEEAAILYANGGYDEARAVLESALETTTSPNARFDLWAMLLDLLRR